MVVPSCRYLALRWLLQDGRPILLDSPSFLLCDEIRIYTAAKFFRFRRASDGFSCRCWRRSR